MQSYNSYNPQRGVLEERYANWRVQAALNWTSSMAPFYSHTGLPLNFAWQTPVALTAAPHLHAGASPGALWACPHALWPVYMLGPAPAMPQSPKPPPLSPQVQQNVPNPHPPPPSSPLASQPTEAQRPPSRPEDSDAFDSEEEVESMNSDAFDSEEEVISASDSDPERKEGGEE